MSTMAYFTMQKMLFTDPRFQSLSSDAKLLYGLMRDRRQLSAQNNWKDKLGTFILMARKSIASLLNKSLPTCRKILKELKDAGLISDIRMGLTRCNRIYVHLLPGETEENLQPAKKQDAPSGKKQGFTPDRKPFPANNPNPSKPNPINPENRRWFLKEGDKWIDGNGKLWEFSEDGVHPYYTRADLTAIGNALLSGG